MAQLALRRAFALFLLLLMTSSSPAYAAVRRLGLFRGSRSSAATTNSEPHRQLVHTAVPTQVLCHLLEVHIAFGFDVNNTGDNSQDGSLVCETTAPFSSQHFNGTPNTAAATATTSTTTSSASTAPWVYRFRNLPLSIRRDLDLQNPETSWLMVSNVLRDDETGSLTIVANATTFQVVPPPVVSYLSTDPNSDQELQPQWSRGAVINGGYDMGGYHHRKLATSMYQNMGINHLLVVRVTYLNYTPSVLADDLRGELFGMGPNRELYQDVNLRRQIASCSFQKLLLQPAPNLAPADRVSTSAPPIRQGVVEVHVTQPVTGFDSVPMMENRVAQQLQAWYGTTYLATQVQHILVVLPNVPDQLRINGGNYLAYGYMRGSWTVYNDGWSTSLSAVAHELGHNFGLAHAGKAESPYGDESGYMGFGSKKRKTPQSCYNAQKHWYLQWFQDRVIALDATTSSSAGGVTLPWTGDLAAFVDYDKTRSDQVVVIQIHSSSATNHKKRLFLQYNRAKTFNVGTREYQDQIVIVSEEDGAWSTPNGLQSWLEATIPMPPIDGIAGAGEFMANFTDFPGLGRVLHIQACQTVLEDRNNVDMIRLSIYLDNQQQYTSCQTLDDPKPTPNPTVSASPSAAPSVSMVPSMVPTMAPSGSIHPTMFCEDSTTDRFVYFIEGDQAPATLDCISLKMQTPALRKTICADNNTTAYDICPDTCGKCDDGCEDDTTTNFLVNNQINEKTCKWLWVRPGWHSHLCKAGHPAYEVCKETCNSCPRPTMAPSTLPSDVPSQAPTEPFCEDSIRSFLLTPSHTTPTNCAWLSKNPDKVEDQRLCDPSNTNSHAHVECPDTCGLCFDNCNDHATQTFFVSEALGYQNCLWLSSRPQWQAKLCHDSVSGAYKVCADTCNSCPPGRPACEDSPEDTTFVMIKGRGDEVRRSCIWLARQTDDYQAKLCSNVDITDRESAHFICPETCGKCTDTCEDTEGTKFYVNDQQGHQDCVWLSTRPSWQKLLCKPGTVPWISCRESCNSCDEYRN